MFASRNNTELAVTHALWFLVQTNKQKIN